MPIKKFDVFPDESVSEIHLLDDFLEKDIFSANAFYVFESYMNNRHRMYWKVKPFEEKYVNHSKMVLNYVKKFTNFKLDRINFANIANFLEKTIPERASVSDRVGFLIDNRYLVKANFTFGLRTVAPGTAHVYQTLSVPLLFYVMDGSGNWTKTERFFPHRQYFFYDRKVLLPYGKYRVPAGTTYFVLAIQRNLFAVDVVPEDLVLPFEYKDPVAEECV